MYRHKASKLKKRTGPQSSLPKPLAGRAGRAEESMAYLVRQTFRAFTHVMEQRLRDHDISISMWFFLRALWDEDGRTQKEFGAELGLTQPTIVAAIDNLEKKKLVQRKRNVVDRRKVNVYLTPAGKALRGELVHYADEVNAAGLKDLSVAETIALRSLLLRVIASLEEDAQQFKANESSDA